MTIPLARTRDILQYLGEHRREGQVICGFSMETEKMLENSLAKLEKKNVDITFFATKLHSIRINNYVMQKLRSKL